MELDGSSRNLKPADKTHSVPKLTFLALKWAVTDKFHNYLHDAKFKALTDNNLPTTS